MENLFRLVSNANKLVFPENTSTDFSTQLHPPIINAKYIGVTKISIFLDASKIIQTPEFLETNSFFYINSEETKSTQIANQSTNSLNDFVINLKDIQESKRIVIEFLTDFVYVATELAHISVLRLTLTNLQGEYHPVLSGATVVTLKYTDMEVEHNIIRLVSSANKGDYPRNNAQHFSNTMRPTINNVDSVALSKISIPVSIELPPPPPTTSETYTDENFQNEYLKKTTKWDIDFGIITVSYIIDETGAEFTEDVKLFMEAGTKTSKIFGSIEDSELGKVIANARPSFEPWDNAAPPGHYYQPYIRINQGNMIDLYLIPGLELKPKIRSGSQKFVSWKGYRNEKQFLFDENTYIEIRHFSSYSDLTNKNIALYNCLYIQAWDINDVTQWIKKPTESRQMTYESSDLFFVKLENVQSVSYGPLMTPIICVIPVNARYIKNDRLTISVPFSNLYFLRTITDKITEFTVSILDEKLLPHTKVKVDGTTTITLVLNYGSNTEIRENSHFEQLIGQ